MAGVASETNRWTLAGDGTSAEIAITNKVFAAADLLVTKVDDGDGSRTDLEVGTDYTVAIDPVTQFATVTLAAASEAGHTYVVVGRTPAVYETAFDPRKSFEEGLLNATMDRLYRAFHFVRGELPRMLRLDPGEPAGEIAPLPPAPVRAGKLFAWSDDGLAPAATDMTEEQLAGQAVLAEGFKDEAEAARDAAQAAEGGALAAQGLAQAAQGHAEAAQGLAEAARDDAEAAAANAATTVQTQTGLGATNLPTPPLDDVAAWPSLGRSTFGVAAAAVHANTPGPGVWDIINLRRSPTIWSQTAIGMTPGTNDGEMYRRVSTDTGATWSAWEQIGASGGMTEIAVGVASGSPTIDFTQADAFDGTYKGLLFLFEDILPATNNVAFMARFSQSSSFLSGASDYQGHFFGSFDGDQTTGATSSSGTSRVVLSEDRFNRRLSNGSGHAYNGEARIWRPHAAGFKKTLFSAGQYRTTAASNAQVTGRAGSALIANTSPIDGVRFMMTSGNIASGTIRCIGVN